MTPEDEDRASPLSPVEERLSDVVRGVAHSEWFNASTRRLKAAALKAGERSLSPGLVSVVLNDASGIGLRIALFGEKSDTNAKYGVAICRRGLFDTQVREDATGRLRGLLWDREGHSRHANLDFRGLDPEDAYWVRSVLCPLFEVFGRDTLELDALLGRSSGER